MKILNSWSITHPKSQWGNPGDVVLVYRENGERKIKTVDYKNKWYFYIKKEDFSKLPDTLKPRTKIGKDWARVYYPNLNYRGETLKSLVKHLEDLGIETFEADVSPMKRYCLDMDIKIENWENIEILYFDIETDDSIGGIEVGRDRILSFAGVDKKGNEYFLTDSDEKNLLVKIKDLISKFDFICGWNSSGFDIPYLKVRFRENKISFPYLHNILHEDMMKRVTYFYSKDPEARQNISSYSLDFISNYFLKEGKAKFKGKIIDLYKKDPKAFKEYNLQDCRLLSKLEKKLGTVELTYKMSQWCGIFASNWSLVKGIDNLILSEANKVGVHYKTNLYQMFHSGEEEKPIQYLGAFVIEPKPGLYKNVYDLDFKSLYPNIIRTFNISPETIEDKGIKTPEVMVKGKKYGGMVYSSKTEGIIPKKIGLLLDERTKIREKMKDLKKGSSEWNHLNVQQLVVKELANSIYGAFGSKWFRSFSIEIAESITATGQYLIQYVKKINEEKGRTVIYGDTDSVFLSLNKGETIEDVLEWINKRIGKHLEETFGVSKSSIQMALDTKFDKYLIEGKKKYVGKIEDKIKYVGFECVKRDTIPMVVKYQKDLFDSLFDGKGDAEEWIKNVKNHVLTNKNIKPEDITIRKKLSKPVKDYKVLSPHLKLVKRLINDSSLSEDGKTQLSTPGSIIKYIIVPGKEKEDIIHISEFKGIWHREHYWTHQVYPPLRRTLETVFPKVDWEKYEIKKERKNAKLKSTKR